MGDVANRARKVLAGMDYLPPTIEEGCSVRAVYTAMELAHESMGVGYVYAFPPAGTALKYGDFEWGRYHMAVVLSADGVACDGPWIADLAMRPELVLPDTSWRSRIGTVAEGSPPTFIFRPTSDLPLNDSLLTAIGTRASVLPPSYDALETFDLADIEHVYLALLKLSQKYGSAVGWRDKVDERTCHLLAELEKQGKISGFASEGSALEILLERCDFLAMGAP